MNKEELIQQINEIHKTKRFKYKTTTSTTMKVKCKKCGHKWDYKGKSVFATCPSCLNKVKVK